MKLNEKLAEKTSYYANNDEEIKSLFIATKHQKKRGLYKKHIASVQAHIDIVTQTLMHHYFDSFYRSDLFSIKLAGRLQCTDSYLKMLEKVECSFFGKEVNGVCIIRKKDLSSYVSSTGYLFNSGSNSCLIKVEGLEFVCDIHYVLEPAVSSLPSVEVKYSWINTSDFLYSATAKKINSALLDFCSSITPADAN